METLTWPEVFMIIAGIAVALYLRATEGEPVKLLWSWLYRTFIDRSVNYEQEGSGQTSSVHVQGVVPNAERNPVQPIQTRLNDLEQSHSALNRSEREEQEYLASVLALLINDVRNYSGSTTRYGVSRALEKSLGLRRGGGAEFATMQALVERELRRLSGSAEPAEEEPAADDKPPITVRYANGSYTLDR